MTIVDGMDDGASITDVTEPQREAQKLGDMESESPPYPSLVCARVVQSLARLPEQGSDTNSALPLATNLLDSHLGETTTVADDCPSSHVYAWPGPAAGLDEHDYRGEVVRNGELHTGQNKSNQATLWTGDKDERLLHLRNVAQLTWPEIAVYFPEMAPGTVEIRCQELTKPRGGQQIVAKRRRQHNRAPNMAAPGFPSSRRPAQLKARTSQTGSSHTCRQWHACYGKIDRHLNDSKGSATILLHPAEKGASHRTSRSGRPILHPFRHRPSEGYV